ncbi:hypothetical protein G9A89_020892 [Geosiphon pyriformis]|nr:hypothetical protein G9A89_020892 [Geosiphon pyriformis]
MAPTCSQTPKRAACNGDVFIGVTAGVGFQPIIPMLNHPFKLRVWVAISKRGKLGFHIFTENLHHLNPIKHLWDEVDRRLRHLPERVHIKKDL